MPISRRAFALPLIALSLVACGKDSAHPPKAAEPPVVRDVTVGAATATDLDDMAEVTGTVKSRTVTTLSITIRPARL